MLGRLDRAHGAKGGNDQKQHKTTNKKGQKLTNSRDSAFSLKASVESASPEREQARQIENLTETLCQSQGRRPHDSKRPPREDDGRETEEGCQVETERTEFCNWAFCQKPELQKAVEDATTETEQREKTRQ